MIDIVVPQISEVASEIVLVRWLKAPGDAVSKGEPLFELDTDKYVVEIEAFEDGTLAEVLVTDGTVVEPGQVVARLEGAAGASISGAPTPPQLREPEKPAPIATHGARGEHGALATPKARRLARDLGVDVSALTGTGKGGMVTADDVHGAAAKAQPTPDPGLEPLSRARRVIGSRMQESKRTAPHFYVMLDVDMSEAVRLRRHCVDKLGWERPPTFTDFIVAACARALRADSDANVRLEDGGLRRRATVDIGLAVGLEDGLTVPVIQEADTARIPGAVVPSTSSRGACT